MNERDTALDNATENGKAPTLWQVVMSVLAAAIGAQNRKNRERDFTHSNPMVFIITRLILRSYLC